MENENTCSDDEVTYRESEAVYSCEPIYIQLPDQPATFNDTKNPNRLRILRKQFMWFLVEAKIILDSTIKLLPLDSPIRIKVQNSHHSLQQSHLTQLCSITSKYKSRHNILSVESDETEGESKMTDICINTDEATKFLDELEEEFKSYKTDTKDKKFKKPKKSKKDKKSSKTLQPIEPVAVVKVQSKEQIPDMSELIGSPKVKLIEYSPQPKQTEVREEQKNEREEQVEELKDFKKADISSSPDNSIVSPPKVDHGMNEVQRTISTGIADIGIEVFPTLIDKSIYVLPSYVDTIFLSSFTTPDGKQIVQIKEGTPNEAFIDRMKGRWAQILVKNASDRGELPKFEIPSPEYDEWVISELKNKPLPDYPTLLVEYYDRIRSIKEQTAEFMNYVMTDYKRLYHDTKSKLGTIPIIPTKYFAHSKEGDKLWRKYAVSFGYWVEQEDKSKLDFEKNVKSLRIEVYKIQESENGKYNNVTEANKWWKKVLDMNVIDLIKIKVRQQTKGISTLARDIPRSVARNVDKIIGEYDPSAIDSLVLSDFASDSENPTMEEKAAYHEYVRKRNKQIEAYNKKQTKNKRPVSPTSLYFNYVGVKR